MEGRGRAGMEGSEGIDGVGTEEQPIVKKIKIANSKLQNEDCKVIYADPPRLLWSLQQFLLLHQLL
jgi:hypothetical protein|tara:strand:+ start:398 stop:595 length:198 start_codon:yes stop_codon:yes gene_type:complete